jgi:hypothetical protein
MKKSIMWFACAGVALAGAAVVFGGAGCSSSSSGPADAGTSGYDVAVGVGLATCDPTSCPAPGLCGGTLLSATTSINFCTVPCSADTDCPQGAACEKVVTNGHCLKSCQGDTDCMGGLTCFLDGGASRPMFCWSPYSGADLIIEAGAPDAGGSPQSDASGSPDATPDAGSEPDGSTAEGGSTEDAPTSEDSGDGSPE